MILLRFVFIVSFVLLIIGCGPSRQEQVQKRLDEILSLKNEGNYNLARLKLDTLIAVFSDQSEQCNVAKEILDEITIMEQQRNLAFLDSMLLVQNDLLKPMMKNFILSDEYGIEKILIHFKQKPENSYNRTFLRAHLNEAGDFYISSRYHGANWIYHQQIKVYNDDHSVFSEVVPEDGFDNRRFDDQGAKWEIVNYKDGKDNGVIDYIASHCNEPLKVKFIGRYESYVVMEQFDKEAIRDAYQISFVLKEINKIKNEKLKVVDLIKKLKH